MKNSVNIPVFLKVIAFLKRKNAGYKAKMSEVSGSEQINKYIGEVGKLNLKIINLVSLGSNNWAHVDGKN